MTEEEVREFSRLLEQKGQKGGGAKEAHMLLEMLMCIFIDGKGLPTGG